MVVGIMFLIMAWYQFVVGPKQDSAREAFQRRRHPPDFDPSDGHTP